MKIRDRSHPRRAGSALRPRLRKSAAPRNRAAGRGEWCPRSAPGSARAPPSPAPDRSGSPPMAAARPLRARRPLERLPRRTRPGSLLPPRAQLRRGFGVAFQAERAHVGEVALPAAFGHRHNVVGIPQRPAPPPHSLKQPAGRVVELALILAQHLGVDPARRAHPTVAREHLGPQVRGIGAQLPLVHTGRSAKREPSGGNRRAAPAAKPPFPRDPTAGLDAPCAHTRNS